MPKTLARDSWSNFAVSCQSKSTSMAVNDQLAVDTDAATTAGDQSAESGFQQSSRDHFVVKAQV